MRPCCIACLSLALLQWRPAAAYCELPIALPKACRPEAATVGPQGKLVIAGHKGLLLFVDLADYTVVTDDFLQQKYEEPLHGLNLQGVALTNPGSTYLYLGLEGGSDLLEYEWHSSHQVFRSFHLRGFPHHGALGLRSVTFVPTTASDQQGYFYVGTEISGEVYIYEAPLLVNEGPKAPAESIKIWTPLQGDKHVAGIEYSDGYLFVSYDDGLSTHVLIFEVLASGLPGQLLEQHQVDVENAVGLAVRKLTDELWEVLFVSASRRKVYGYNFRFVYGFAPHGFCAAAAGVQEAPPWRSSAAFAWPWLANAALAMAMARVSLE